MRHRQAAATIGESKVKRKSVAGDVPVVTLRQIFFKEIFMNAEEYYERGVEYFEKEDYDMAIADTSEAIRLNQNYSLAYVTRAVSYRAKKNYSHAWDDFREAIRLDPDNASAYGSRGSWNVDLEEYGDAIADLEMALKLQPSNDGFRQLLMKAKAGRNKKVIQRIIGVFLVMGIGAFVGNGIGNSISVIIGVLGGGIIGWFVGPLVCGLIWDIIMSILFSKN
jgi:tetratricopeptide (TPR) repeat protein